MHGTREATTEEKEAMTKKGKKKTAARPALDSTLESVKLDTWTWRVKERDPNDKRPAPRVDLMDVPLITRPPPRATYGPGPLDHLNDRRRRVRPEKEAAEGRWIKALQESRAEGRLH